MLKWAFLFFIIAIISGLIGFNTQSAQLGSFFRVVFFFVLTIFITLLIMSLFAYIPPTYIAPAVTIQPTTN